MRRNTALPPPRPDSPGRRFHPARRHRAESVLQNPRRRRLQNRRGGGERIEWEIIVDGENTVTGEKGILRIPCAKLAADGDFDWFKDDFNTASFKGTAVLADGNTAPYSFEVYK